MPIRQLPTHLVNQIAAGEVIERPASVVKELVENSVDANASHIHVEVEDGGATLIRIRDDGLGIPAHELPLALAAHATSKLQTADDLACIRTLGFRGEALASIASVSRLRLSSRHTTPDGNTEPAGCAIEQAGDQLTTPGPVGMPPGTVIEVRDLFFNTPARRKFLRSPGTEVGHISDTLTRAAITHPHVGFTLTHNGRKSLELPTQQDRRQRCIDLLGRELEEGLLEAEHHDALNPQHDAAPAHVWALLGQPSLARATAKFLYLCVNGRPVKDRNLQHAVKEAYRGLIPPDRQPIAVVHLTLDPHLVDVNVHPTKAEVRFREPTRVHGLVLSTLRRTLLGNDLTPTAQLPQSFGSFLQTPNHADAERSEASGAPFTTVTTPTSPPLAKDFVDYFRRMDPRQKGFVYEQVKREMADLSNTAGPTAAPPPAVVATPTPILQVHDSYVVTQDADGLLIVDQHALHERIMFEELRHRILDTGQPLESQRLLMPVTLGADIKRLALLAELQPLLTSVGIEAEPMGPRTLGIHAFPSLLFDRGVDPAGFMNELLDAADNGQLPIDSHTATEAALHKVLDMMSCKAAVKAGDRMSNEELNALLAKRDQIERSSNCPHGRPTTLRLSIKDLARQFGRS